jgi:hypothetical protein
MISIHMNVEVNCKKSVGSFKESVLSFIKIAQLINYT